MSPPTHLPSLGRHGRNGYGWGGGRHWAEKMIVNVLKEADAISYTSKYFSSDSDLMISTKKILSLLKQEVINNPERINQRILRTMHDIWMSSYKDFDNTPMEQAINNVTEILFDELPCYKTLTRYEGILVKGIQLKCKR